MSQISTTVADMEGTEIAGIYRFVLGDTRCYVGSSEDVVGRWKEHIWLLKTNQHHSRYLQFAWNKYGEEAFHLELIESSAAAWLLSREQFWIDTLNSVFNMNRVAGKPPGFHVPHTAATKAKMRAAQLAQPPRTAEHSKNISLGKIAKRSERETCIHGHLLEGENIHWRLNFRGTWVLRCRQCHRDQARRAREKQKRMTADG